MKMDVKTVNNTFTSLYKISMDQNIFILSCVYSSMYLLMLKSFLVLHIKKTVKRGLYLKQTKCPPKQTNKQKQ